MAKTCVAVVSPDPRGQAFQIVVGHCMGEEFINDGLKVSERLALAAEGRRVL